MTKVGLPGLKKNTSNFFASHFFSSGLWWGIWPSNCRMSWIRSFPFRPLCWASWTKKLGMSWGEGRQEDEHLKIDMQNYIVVKIYSNDLVTIKNPSEWHSHFSHFYWETSFSWRCPTSSRWRTGYISIYISLVHVCCVCRVLEDTAAQFALPGASGPLVLGTCLKTMTIKASGIL